VDAETKAAASKLKSKASGVWMKSDTWGGRKLAASARLRLDLSCLLESTIVWFGLQGRSPGLPPRIRGIRLTQINAVRPLLPHFVAILPLISFLSRSKG
jgi:hypothetical protein